jgi:RNA polymerase sigma factor (sigma-70 family)
LVLGSRATRARVGRHSSRGTPVSYYDPLVPATDFELLQAWRTGDRKAGGELFDRYFMPLRRFFRNKVGDDFEELVQRTLTRCVEGQARFRGDGNFRSYLFGIAYNVLREHVRGRERDRAQQPDEDASVADLGLPGPSTVVGFQREQRLLLEALRRLPLSEQVVLELFYWEQLSSAEIGDALEIPRGTVRSRLRLARERLRGHLDELARDAHELQSTVDNLARWAADLRVRLG